jgi:hypothetical protein
MATQTLEFSAGTGLTLSCKLFALGSDTVVDTQTATERTNDKNRYVVAFTSIPAGAYRLNAFVGATGGFANEVYDLTLSTATFYPREEAAAGGLDAAGVRAAVGLASANLDTQLSGIAAKTQLITTGTVTYSGPVDPTGKIASPIIRGDDYLAANNRAFNWTITAITGLTAATCTSRLGFKSGTTTLVVNGTVTDNGNGTWTASHDMTRTQSATLTQQQYDWSVEIVHSGGTEITPVRSGRGVAVAEKFS